MGVKIISEEPIQMERPALRLVMAPEPIPPQVKEKESNPAREEFFNAMLVTLSATAMILAARVVLVMAVLGAFVLALLTVGNPSIGAIVTTGIYCIGVIAPLAYLALKKG